MKLFEKRTTARDIVSKKQTRTAKRAVSKAAKQSSKDQHEMLKRAKNILRTQS